MLALPPIIIMIIVMVVAETQIEEMTTTITTNPGSADLVMCKSKHSSNCKVSCNSMKRKVSWWWVGEFNWIWPMLPDNDIWKIRG